MSGAFLYQWVLASPAGERLDAVQSLNGVSLCRLSGWLAQDYEENGTTGEVLGMCIVEQAMRYAKREQEGGNNL